VGTHPKN